MLPEMYPDTHTIVQREHWIFATTYSDILIVYRTPILLDTDPTYANVAAMLKQRHEVLWRQTVPDPDMFFGQAELSIYRIEA